MPAPISNLPQSDAQSPAREAYLRRLASIREDAQAGDPLPPRNASSAGPMAPEASSRDASPRKPRLAMRTIYKWFMRFLLVVTLVVLVGLIWFLWRPAAQTASDPVESVTSPRMTAKGSHQVAEAVALSWAEDAQLVSLSATWDAGEAFQGGEGDWSLVYYSPRKTATALVSVHGGQASLIDAHGVTQPIGAPQSSNWRIDSAMVISRLREAGGNEFLRSQPEATVSMSLNLSQDAVWSVRLIDQMSRRTFAARVSIDSGEVVGIQQSG